MRINPAAAAVFVLIAASCSHVDTAGFEKVYFESVAQKVAKAEGVLFVPTPAAVAADLSASMQASVLKSAQEKAAFAAAVSSPAKVTPRAQAPVTGTAAAAASAVVSLMRAPAATPVAKQKKKKFKIKELEIAADSMTYNKDTSIAVFNNNVILTAEGVKLKCDSLTSKNYKDNAEATGNVRAYYKAQKTALKCGRVKYGNRMSMVRAFDGVVTEKYLDNGNTITMHADEADFDTEYGSIEAKKIKKRVKVIFKDIVAFSDKVVYNDETGELEMSGKPVVIRANSSFTAYKIKVDTARKTMKMESDIWTRIFYGDLKKAEAEVKLETDKDAAPR